jgi:hypothetical protein
MNIQKHIYILASLLALTSVPCSLHAQTAERRTAVEPTAQATELAAIEKSYRNINRDIGRAILKECLFTDETSDGQWRVLNYRAGKSKGAEALMSANAVAWLRAGKVVAAEFFHTSPSGDWTQLAIYYFRTDGTIAKTELELNTFYGHVTAIRKKFYNEQGKLLGESAQYYDLKTKQEKRTNADGEEFIERPAQHYPTVKTLPVFSLLAECR